MCTSRLFLSVFLTVFLLGIQTVNAQIEEKKSETTGALRLESRSMQNVYAPSYEGAHAAYRAVYENDPDEGQTWVVVLYGFTEDTTAMSTAEQVKFQIAGRTVEPVRVESKTHRLDGSFLEVKRAVLTRPTFELIATAYEVSVSVGPDQFQIDHDLRRDMRLILDRVPAESSPQTARNGEDSSG